MRDSLLVLGSVFAVGLAICLAWNYWVGPDRAISVAMAVLGSEAPIIAFLFGLIVGMLASHWWWQVK